MPVIYLKLRAIFQPNGGCIDFFPLKWDHYFIFVFSARLNLILTELELLSPL